MAAARHIHTIAIWQKDAKEGQKEKSNLDLNTKLQLKK